MSSNYNAINRIPIVVGVTGHRDPVDPSAVQTAIKTLLMGTLNKKNGSGLSFVKRTGQA